MANFIDSFKAGMSAAERAIANKDEIDEVIDSLSEQLATASGGRIKVRISEKVNPLRNLFSSVEEILTKKKQWAIIASNPLSDFQPQELAEWKFDENGYPCRLITEDRELFCEDKQALESALSSLLEEPATGKKLKALLNQKPKTTISPDQGPTP